MTAKYGTPYFSNYINSDMNPRMFAAVLQAASEPARASKKSGGYFGSGESTGSIGVVTINMPRIAYLQGMKKILCPAGQDDVISARPLSSRLNAMLSPTFSRQGFIPILSATSAPSITTFRLSVWWV
jgi:hypothetical protein